VRSGPGVQILHRQEREYASFLARGGGYVCNNIGYGRRWHTVHRAACEQLNRTTTGFHTNVPKACSRRLRDLTGWLTERYGPEGVGFNYCPHCFKDAPSRALPSGM